MNRVAFVRRSLWTCLAFVGLVMTASAQPDSIAIRGESQQTRKRLLEAEQKLQTGKASDAFEDLLLILDEAGDDLVLATRDGRSLIAARQYVHYFLSQLPPTMLQSYRDRIQDAADQLLKEGRDRRDPRPLLQLLNRYANSRSAIEATLILGELAFERGDFHLAETRWKSLRAESTEPGEWMPPLKNRPALDLPSLQAKIALAQIYQGKTASAEEKVKAIAAKPDKTVPGVEQLQRLLTNPPILRDDAIGSGTWDTLGANASRQGRANGRWDPARLPSRPAWKTEIPKDIASETDRSRWRSSLAGAVRSVAFHPVVCNGKAYICDVGRVIGFDMRSGLSEVIWESRKQNPTAVPAADLRLPVPYDADLGLTVADGHLLVRVGPAALMPPMDANRKDTTPSELVCLRPAANLNEPATVVWRRVPPVAAGTTAAWEAAPIVVDGRILAVFARSEGGRLIHSLVCYEWDGEQPLWQTELTECPTTNGAEVRTRRDYLTQAGANVIFCSHTGAIVAVNARTGKAAWGFRYPHKRKHAASDLFRDVSPPIYSDGRVFVAPNDSDYVFALESETGRPIWTDGLIQVDHLLGVAAGKLVAVIAGPNRGIRGYDVETGSRDAPLGWSCHDAPDLRTFGRGLLTDEYILWPTIDGVVMLRLKDGQPLGRQLAGPHGNLAYASDCLLVATPTAVWAYSYRSGTPGDIETPPAIRVIQADPPPPPLLPKISSPAHVAELPPTREPKSNADTFGLWGEQQLIKRTADGKIVWQLDSLKRQRMVLTSVPRSSRFIPEAYVDSSRIVIQTDHERRYLIDARNGRVIDDSPTAHHAWVAPPIKWEDTFILADGPDRITSIDTLSGLRRWQYDAGHVASLRGDAARPFLLEGMLYLAVVRNHGVELERVDPRKGKPLWRQPVFLPIPDFDPRSPAANAEALFITLPDRLVAFSPDSGGVLWTSPLPETSNYWHSVLSRNLLLVYPSQAIAGEDLGNLFPRLVTSWLQLPNLRRLLGLMATGYMAWYDRTVPVLLIDPETGTTRQRLDLACRGPDVKVLIESDSVIVHAGERRYQLK